MPSSKALSPCWKESLDSLPLLWGSPGIWVLLIWGRGSQEIYTWAGGNWYNGIVFHAVLREKFPQTLVLHSEMHFVVLVAAAGRFAVSTSWVCVSAFLPQVSLMKYPHYSPLHQIYFLSQAKQCSVCSTVRSGEQSWFSICPLLQFWFIYFCIFTGFVSLRSTRRRQWKNRRGKGLCDFAQWFFIHLFLFVWDQTMTFKPSLV